MNIRPLRILFIVAIIGSIVIGSFHSGNEDELSNKATNKLDEKNYPGDIVLPHG